MKRIGIDARLINQTGVGVYTKNLLSNLEKYIKNIEVYVYLRDEDFELIHFSNPLFIKRKANFHWHSFNEQIGFLLQLYKDKLDLMHFTYFSYPVLYKRPFVITIHDIIPYTHRTGRASTRNPLLHSFKHLAYSYTLLTGLNNAQRIIAPTKTVAKDIRSRVGIKPLKQIVVTYEGVNASLMEAKENHDLENTYSKPFFIYIGNFYPHKNVDTLIRAFAKMKNDHNLILIGPDDFFSKRTHALVSELKADNIKFHHNPRTEDFVFFYKHAKALIHPSLAEGFGLPLVEASYFKCPIIASRIPVFYEILGDHYLKFDPRDEREIVAKISELLENKRDKNTLFLPADIIEEKFSFDTMALQTLRVYESTL